MKQHWKRLFIAAFTSSSVFGATLLWYEHSQKSSSQKNNSDPIAYVETIHQDLQKRAPARLLWQSAAKGDPLYDGEAIRTNSDSEARIVFANSDSYLDLEADSLIVLKRLKGEIALDLLEGHLFVKVQSDNPGTNIVLNSEKGKFKLTQATANISRKKGKALDLQVLAGQAVVKKENGNEQTLEAQTDIRILAPNPEKTLIIGAEAPEPTRFEWQALAKGTNYKFSYGLSRETLEASTSTNQSFITLNLDEGKYFWQIEAFDSNGKQIGQTPVQRANIVARHTPLITTPAPDAQIVSPGETDGSLTFKWQLTADVSNVKIEIFQDSEQQKLAAVKTFTHEDSHTFNDIPVGTYYWRLSATYTDSDIEISSKLAKITLLSSLESRPLTISVAPEIQTQVFDPAKSIRLAWSADRPERASLWKLEIHPEAQPEVTLTRVETPHFYAQTHLPKAGRYIASISAFNNQGQKIGENTLPLILTEIPLLNAPQFLPETGELIAEADGQTTLTWTPIKDAKAYAVIVRRDDKILSDKIYHKPEARFKNLLPGEYQVQILSVDRQERRGPASLPRPLVVPETSNLKAPSLKKVQVN